MNKETTIRVAKTLVSNGSGIVASAAVSRSLHEKTDLENTEVAMISIFTLWGVRSFSEELFDLAVEIGSAIKARITAKSKEAEQEEEEEENTFEEIDQEIDEILETPSPEPAAEEEIETK